MSDLMERLSRALEGRYRVTRELGRGGMAVVYLAHDLKHRRPVAIKVMKPEVAHGLGVPRFLREIETVAQLAHPNILPLHDSGTADGLLYFVMPFVEEESLRDRLDRFGVLPPDEAIRIIGQIGDALDYAHSRGLIHRDIKPGNVLFQAGHAVVADFGVARAVSAARDGELTDTGAAIGTLKYMSPEQATGDGEIDARSDVYSLGCVVYEMLTGEAPFAASGAQAMLARKVTQTPPPVSSVRAGIPATLDAVVSRTLAIEPTARFETPGALTRALVEASTARAIAVERRRRVTRARMRWVAAVAATIALAGGSFWLTTALEARPIERLAVLPLASSTGDPGQSYFLEGVHAELISQLFKAGFVVINPTSVLPYRDSERPVTEIADELGVEAVIEGEASLDGSALSLDLRMTDARSAEIVWLDSFDGEVRDVLSLYGDVTRGIATAARFVLSSATEATLAGAPVVDPQIQEYLWQARYYLSRHNEEAFSNAQENYELVLARDSSSAAALVGLASVWGGRAQAGLISADEAMARGDPYIAMAMAADSTLPEVQAMLAGRRTWLQWDWEGAEATFRRAIDYNPTNPLTHRSYAWLLHYLDRDEEAREQFRLALELDPLSRDVRTWYAMSLNWMGQYEAADSVLRAVLELEPDFQMALTSLRTTYHLMGRHDEALEMWRASNAGDPEALEALARGQAEGGYEGALRAMAEFLVSRSATMHVPAWQIGTAYTRAGDAEQALDYLELAFEEGDPNMPSVSVDPIFDYMRDEPRFQALIEGLDLPG